MYLLQPGQLINQIIRMFQQHGFWAAVLLAIVGFGLWGAMKWYDENKNRM